MPPSQNSRETKTGRLAAIREGLAQVWDTGGRRFVTFEIETGGSANADLWVQWIDGQINLRWPFPDDPASGLPRRGVRLPPGVRASSFIAGENAIVHAWDLRIDEAADLVEVICSRCLAADSTFAVSARFENS